MSDAAQQSADLSHQAGTTFPRLDSAVVDPTTGLLSKTWYYFLLKIWQLLGGTAAPALQNAAFLASQSGATDVEVFSASSGKQILPGSAISLDSSGGAFTAPSSGVVAAGAGVSLTVGRGGTSVLFSGGGGTVFVATGDVVTPTPGVGDLSMVFFPFIFL